MKIISLLLVDFEGLEINVNDSFNQRSPAVLALIKLKKVSY